VSKKVNGQSKSEGKKEKKDCHAGVHELMKASQINDSRKHSYPTALANGLSIKIFKFSCYMLLKSADFRLMCKILFLQLCKVLEI
jgi:hypothetical protein